MDLPPRFWFKWNRFKSALRAALGSGEKSYETAHRMCPNCRGLIDRSAAVCPLCGVPTAPTRERAGTTHGRILGGLIPFPSTATSVLVAANVFLYAIAWYLTQSAASAELRASPSMGGIDGYVLFRLGSKFGPAIMVGEWWRLVTAIFLHAGLLHIGFNLWCLIDLGSTVESMFTTTKFIVLYLVTGIFGFILSQLWSPLGNSVGASGAVLGLIGVLIGASFHHGSLGKDIRSQLWRWVVYIFVFGLFFAVDNAAHIGGLASGALLGYLVPEGEPTTRRSDRLWNTLALISVLIVAASFVLMTLQINRPL